MSKKILVTSSTQSTIYEEIIRALDGTEMYDEVVSAFEETGEIPLDDMNIVGAVEARIANKEADGLSVISVDDDTEHYYQYAINVGCGEESDDEVDNVLVIGKDLRVINLAWVETYADIVQPVKFIDQD